MKADLGEYMKKYPTKQKKIKKSMRKKPILRKWGLAARLEHRRIKGKQKRKQTFKYLNYSFLLGEFNKVEELTKKIKFMNEKTKQIQIQAAKDELKGVYSNAMQVSHTQEEFILDFLNITGATGVLSSRVILSPGHFRRITKALEENLRKYEERFGEITPTETPEREIGFKP